MPSVLVGSWGGGRFLMDEVPLNTHARPALATRPYPDSPANSTLGALFPRGGPVQDPVLTAPLHLLRKPDAERPVRRGPRRA